MWAQLDDNVSIGGRFQRARYIGESMETKRIIMCGSRTWQDPHIIADELLRLKRKHGESLVIVHGDEPNGADNWIRRICNDCGIKHNMYCAAAPKHTPHALFRIVRASDWQADGLKAGPLRNKAMRDSGNIAGCVAFRSEGKSSGTDGMLRLCADVGIPRIVYMADGTRHISE